MYTIFYNNRPYVLFINFNFKRNILIHNFSFGINLSLICLYSFKMTKTDKNTLIYIK